MNLFLSILSTVILAFVVWKINKVIQRYRTYIKIYTSDKVIRFGKFHPLWGHLHLFKSLTDFSVQVQKGMRETGRKLTCYWMMCFYPNLGVCHPDTAKIILKSTEPKNKQKGGGYFVLLPWLGDGLLISDGKKWERNRKMLTPAFHFDVLRPYVEIYNKVVDILLEKLEAATFDGGSVEIHNPIGLATLDILLQCSLSYDGKIQKYGSHHPYVNAVRRLTSLAVDRTMKPWLHPDIVYKLSASGREFFRHTKYVHDFAENIIRKRKQSLNKNMPAPGERLDFLDILLSARDDDGTGLTEREIRDEVDTFMFEGHDTTASSLSWAIYALAQHQEEQQKVYEEVYKVLDGNECVKWSNLQDFPRLALFLKESMRMYSPVPSVGRITTRELNIEGLLIPPNMEIYIQIDNLNQREDIWKDPKKFRPDRFLSDSDRDPFSFIPFSAGPRNCIGQHFALNEQKVTLARLVQRFRVLPDPNHEPMMDQDLVMRSKNGILIKLEKR